MKWFFICIIVFLVIATVFISGCVQQESKTTSGVTAENIKKSVENEAENVLENEIEASVENITMSDIEALLVQ